MSELNFEALIAERKRIIAEFDKQVEAQLVPEVQKAIKELENYGIIGVTWHQFTPYFNDGESCEFSVHDFYPVFYLPDEIKDFALDDETLYYILENPSRAVDEELKWFSEDERAVAKYFLDKFPTNAWYFAFEKVTNLLESIPEDIMRNVFGDHVHITILADSYDIEEFNHD